MLPPFYYKGMSDEGLFRAFAHVIEGVGDGDLRLFFYHFPRLSGVPITTGLIDRTRDAFPEVVAGVKDSSGDREHTLGLIARYPELAVFPGAETLLLAGLEAGGAGCITASANANVTVIRRLYDAWCGSGAGTEANALDDAVRAVREGAGILPDGVVAQGRRRPLPPRSGLGHGAPAHDGAHARAGRRSDLEARHGRLRAAVHRLAAVSHRFSS